MRRLDLVSDCGRCAAVCCITTSFEASEDFAFDKPAGVACKHLTPQLRCAIHPDLVGRGCSGCAVYECHGAGPRATLVLADAPMQHQIEGFLVLRCLHELLWLLSMARELCLGIDAELVREIDQGIARLEALASSPPERLIAIDTAPHDATAHALLRRVGAALGGRQALPAGVV